VSRLSDPPAALSGTVESATETISYWAITSTEKFTTKEKVIKIVIKCVQKGRKYADT